MMSNTAAIWIAAGLFAVGLGVGLGLSQSLKSLPVRKASPISLRRGPPTGLVRRAFLLFGAWVLPFTRLPGTLANALTPAGCHRSRSGS